MDYEQLKKLMSEQKDEMTAAERLKAYNAGEEVDYNPYTLQAPDPAMADIFGFTTTQFAKDFEVKSEGEEMSLGLTTSMWDWGLRRLAGRLALC